MTRNEEILNKAIDYSEIEDNFIEYDDCGDVCDDRELIEKAFIQGAKWADKTMLEKVCEWLEFNYTEYLDNSRLGINMKEMVEDFRKAMKK